MPTIPSRVQPLKGETMSKIRSIILAGIGVSIILLMVHLAEAGDVIEVVRRANHLILLTAVFMEFVAFFLWAVR